MNCQKFDLPAGQVKNRYDHKRHEKMERQTEPSRCQSAVEGVAPSNPAAIPCNPRRASYAALPPDHERGGNIENTDDQTGSDDCAKRPGVFHTIRRSLLRKAEN